MSDWKHESLSVLTCPYCGFEMDDWDWEFMNEPIEVECPECEKDFIGRADVAVVLFSSREKEIADAALATLEGDGAK